MDIVITEFSSRKKPNGKIKHTTWEDLVERLKSPVITEETIEEYWKASNEDRTAIKDVGGYVAGEFENGKRDKTLLKSRYILTIDADEATKDDVDNYECCYDYTFFAHTTHTSTDEHPRLRWLFPLTRPVTAEEYRLLIGVAKTWVGADTIDETTDQPERLMFWPSVSVDADYSFWQGGTVVVDPDTFLDEIDPVDYESIKSVSARTASHNSGFDDLDDMDFIPVGKRNDAVFRYASKLREAGLDDDILLESIRLYNNRYCEDPLPESELKTIVGSVHRFKKGEKITRDMYTASDDFKDLGEEKKPEEDVFGLDCIDDLWKEDLGEQVFIVPDLIPTGVGGIVAPPKFGKSWLCLDLCIAVATGTTFLGFPTNQNEVLYLALEDGKKRLDRRSRIVAGEERKILKSKLHYDLKAPTLDDGLLDKLERTLKKFPGIKLIVIDTLQKVRGEMRRGESVYKYDYREISDLHNFAIDHDIALVVVHHTKKGIDDSDPLSNASGSNGLTGSFDFSLNLSKRKRKDKTTKLDIISRDVEEKTYVLQFDKSSCRWINLGEEQEVSEDGTEAAYDSDPLVKTIKYNLSCLANAIPEEDLFTEEVVWEVSAKDLVDEILALCGETEYDSPISIGKKLSRIASVLKDKDGITYENVKTTGGKRVQRFSVDRF